MNKLSRLVKRAEFKHLLLLVGVGAVGVGTWRAFFDHNSTPVLIVGAALAFAALISDRLTSAEVAVGNSRAVFGLAAKGHEQNASDLRVAAGEVSQATEAEIPEPSKRLLLDALRRLETVAERSDDQARLLESAGALYPAESTLGLILQTSRGMQVGDAGADVYERTTRGRLEAHRSRHRRPESALRPGVRSDALELNPSQEELPCRVTGGHGELARTC